MNLSLNRKSFAKVNTKLKIGKLCNIVNLHKIDSEVLILPLCDKINFNIKKSTKNNINIKIINYNNFPMPSAEENLIYKSIISFFEFCNTDNFNIDIVLEKNIPPMAGLGGGSSNAAITLKILNELFPDKTDIKILAKKLGSDISLFLDENKYKNISNFGDTVEPMNIPENFKNKFFTIVKPNNVNIDTGLAYQEFDKFGVKKNNINDFEELILDKTPKLKNIKNTLKNLNCYFSVLCGSGSAIFATSKKRLNLNMFNNDKYWIWQN